MAYDLPPIAKLAERLLVDIERAVRAFPRYHKYTVGTQLREQAMEVVKLCNRAWRDRDQQLRWLDGLVWAIDELKVLLQIAKQVHAYQSFRQFEALIRLADDVGKQAGGWKRQQQKHPKGQNPARSAAPECAQILSTCAASTGANP
ncbi:four helix bundle protein [Lysobacter sp. 5GHs7-4]|uniref:four helix bundle protein n=1 Tax=Lysobacter sp. 5GHs7-4 TaxID=2904253 RepID=UPI001E528727|nr:four helix bundle protein [Lysobacter sp. 5GHs7-4]UHQ21933.1 four helix bundle protein [Lysobacter sp. 5GHs7-4]